ncbi:serine/arginine repetitive matrix protein 1-like [Anoplophora glabripennis]|uniref:serine/arginine repetitive matrix protein 1-like n=1 Tax=Anoplophora glabripennis TaxID=217634 RepID=UPI000C75F3DF|nr:serine/arginine repetitive matrix protein 1-like [Anoplophora glabripennis]
MAPTGKSQESVAPQKTCKRCKVMALSGLKCIKCDTVSHNGCVKLLKNVISVELDEIICCAGDQTTTGNEAEFYDALDESQWKKDPRNGPPQRQYRQEEPPSQQPRYNNNGPPPRRDDWRQRQQEERPRSPPRGRPPPNQPTREAPRPPPGPPRPSPRQRVDDDEPRRYQGNAPGVVTQAQPRPGPPRQ